MRAVSMVAAITLFAGSGLASFSDVIVLTVETADGNEYQSNSLRKRGKAWQVLR